MKGLNRGERIGRSFVGGLIGLALVALSFYLAGRYGGFGLSILLLYEAWALINGYENDTISDILRDFSRRQPMVPWLFGAGTCAAIAYGYLDNRWLMGAVLYVQGHIFFALKEKKRVIESE